jgi:hypothetical protein
VGVRRPTVRSELAAGDVARMPIREFVDGGYLQEVNRRLLHPCGLALEVEVAAGPTAVVKLTQGGVEALRELIDFVRVQAPDWVDHMDELEERLDEAELLEQGDAASRRLGLPQDGEGVIFADDAVSPEKARRVQEDMTRRAITREAALGYIVQPAGLEETTALRPE